MSSRGYGDFSAGFGDDDFEFSEPSPDPAPELEPPRVSVRYRPGRQRLQITLGVLACIVAVGASFFAGWRVGRDNIPTPAPVTVTADPSAPSGVPPVVSPSDEPSVPATPFAGEEQHHEVENTENDDVGQG